MNVTRIVKLQPQQNLQPNVPDSLRLTVMVIEQVVSFVKEADPFTINIVLLVILVSCVSLLLSRKFSNPGTLSLAGR